MTRDGEHINWYPGHMDASLRAMKTALGRVDVVIEVCDARVARSSRWSQLSALAGQKTVVTLFNKADVADPEVTTLWVNEVRSREGHWACGVSLSAAQARQRVESLLTEATQALAARAAARGYVVYTIKAMVVGVPNSGKSTLINRLSGRSKVRTENRPGVTRTLSWIRVGPHLECLDTPGLLPPRLGDNEAPYHLAASGAIPRRLLPLEAVARRLLSTLNARYSDCLIARYGFVPPTLEALAQAKGLIGAGGDVDLKRAASRLIDDFQTGRIGRVSLETP